MTDPRRRLIDAGYRANELVHNTNIIGTVDEVFPPDASIGETGPTYTVRVNDRRGEDYAADRTHSYLLRGVASAVPLQRGHRVFLTIVNGDIRQGVYITGTVEPPNAQVVSIGEDRWQPMFRRHVTAPDGALQATSTPWIINGMFTHTIDEEKTVQYFSRGSDFNTINKAVGSFLHKVTTPSAIQRQIDYSKTPSYGTGPGTPPIFPPTEAETFRSNAPAIVNVLGVADGSSPNLASRRIPDSPQDAKIVITSPKMDIHYTFRMNRSIGYSWGVNEVETDVGPFSAGGAFLAHRLIDLSAVMYIGIGIGNAPPFHRDSHAFSYKADWVRAEEGSASVQVRDYMVKGMLAFHDFEGTEFSGTATLRAPTRVGEEVDISIWSGIHLVPPTPTIGMGDTTKPGGLGDVLATTFYTAGWQLDLRELGVGSAL